MNRGGPARTASLLYLTTAHVSILLACVLAGLWPRAVAGFFYHAWMVALVHLVTLGWITCSILGAFFIVAPIALRTSMPARRVDYVAFGFVLTGLVGMVGHFWIQEYGGMAWSAATATSGVLLAGSRMVRAVRRAPIQFAVRLHIVLACLNLAIAASLGVLLGFDKVYHILPGFVLSNVFAHAHLAAIGWATMMVVGVGYRLLPMVLPSRMPDGPSLIVSGILLEAGVLGLAGALLTGSRLAPLAGLVTVGGLLAFLGHVVWMLRSPAPKPAGLPRIDFARLHAAAAGCSLLLAIGIGAILLVTPPAPWTLRAAAAYGIFGLVGFLAQMIVAMETRLLPLAAWFWEYERTDFAVPPTPPHAMRDRVLQAIGFAGWALGVPMLAVGLFQESARLVAIGAWSLAGAVAAGTIDAAMVAVRRARPFSANARPAATRTEAGA